MTTKTKTKPKLKSFDVSNVESGRGPQPKPGLYTGKIDGIEEKVSQAGNEMLEITLRITNKKGPQKEFKGAKVRVWVLTDSDSPAAFKLKELVEAVRFKSKGTIPALIKKALGTEIQFKVEGSTYTPEGSTEAQYSASVGTLYPLDSDDDADDDDAEEEEEEEDEEEDESEEEEEESGDDDEEEVDDYNEWSVSDLKEECEARDLKKTGGKSALVKRLIEDDESADDPFAD